MDRQNMELYDWFRSVPNEAKKQIKGGRLKGFTDINPMWRIKVLTEVFGPCGIGWWYKITDKRLEGSGNEIRAFVDIELYYRWNGEISQPIPGTGGSSFLTKEQGGAYTSDECYKMALTDAISVSAKALGVGADVFYERDRDKYTQREDDPSQQQDQEPPKATAKRYTCEECGKEIRPYTDKAGNPVSLRAHSERSMEKFGKVLCLDCIQNQ